MSVRREEFETQGEVTFDVTLPAGRLEIQTGPPGRATVELEPLGGDDSQELVDEAQVEVSPFGGRTRLTVQLKNQRRFLRFGNAQVLVRAQVPEGADVDASVASADVQTRGPLGNAHVEVASGGVDLESAASVEVSSASGDIRLRSVEGDLSVSTASGDVRVERIGGQGRIRTASGDVVVSDARGAIEVQSASGDQRVEAVREGRVSLRSASGDLSVGVRQGSALWVDARSMSGDTTSEIDLDADASDVGDAPLVELRAISMSGDVRVLRAPAA
jgi:hypothetical protein